jgi:hypothetical protein
MAQTQSSLFGPGLDLVQQAVDDQARQQAMEYTKMEPGQAPVYMAARAGQAIGGAIDKLSGYEDPAIKRARLLDEAKAEVTDSGIDIFQDSRGYYRKAFESLNKRGLNDEALQVRNLLIAEETATADAALKRAQAQKEMAAAERGNYVALGKGGAINTTTGEVIAPVGGAEEAKAQSDVGKIESDYQKGFITLAQRNERLAKINYIAPPSGGSRGVDVSTGVDYFYNPVTKDWKQAKKGTDDAVALLADGYVPSEKGSQSTIKAATKYIAKFPDGTQKTVDEGSPEFADAVSNGADVFKVGTGVGSTESASEKRAPVTMYAPPGYAGEQPQALSVSKGSEEHQNLLSLGFTEGKATPLPKRNIDLSATLKAYNTKSDNALASLKTLTSAKAQLETSQFKTGMASGVRTALGSIAEFFERPEAAQIINSDATDSQVLSATFNDLVRGMVVSMGDGGKLLSKELDLSREVSPNVGMTPKAIYLMLSLAQQNMEFQSKWSTKGLEIVQSDEVKKELDPVVKNQLVVSKMQNWIAKNTPEVTRQTLDQFRAEFAKMEKAKDAVDINAYNTNFDSSNGRPAPRKFDLQQLNSNKGKFVMDKGVLYVLNGGIQYKKGDVITDSSGKKVVAPQDFVAPDLIPY